MNPTNSKKPVDECQILIDLANSFLPLDRWNFQLSARIDKPYSSVIYNSERCRLNFVFSGWDVSGDYTISIYYGRLHAPDIGATMVWNGEECHCWHDIKRVLNYLDGLSPQKAVKVKYEWPLVMEQFRQSDLGKSLSARRYQAEWLTRMHATAWKHYGERLFELFDVRRADLWSEYVDFIREFYKLKGVSPNIVPSEDKIC
jgi:hypothetical protein